MAYKPMTAAILGMALAAAAAPLASPRSRALFEVYPDDPEEEIRRIIAEGGPRFDGYDLPPLTSHKFIDAQDRAKLRDQPLDTRPKRKFKHNRRG